MRLLALETSSEAGSVALLSGGDIAEHTIATPREQTSTILPLVRSLLDEAGIALEDLDGVAFGRGPGSFTGIRVATAVAQGLGLALELPLVPISSLACIAQGVLRTHGYAQTVVCIDARMGEVFWARYAAHDGRAVLCGTEQLASPQSVHWEGSGAWAAAGNGFAVYAEPLAALGAAADSVLADCAPLAKDLIPLALEELTQGRTETYATALPVYLRRENAWRR